MNTVKNVLVSALVAVLVSLGFFAVSGPKTAQAPNSSFGAVENQRYLFTGGINTSAQGGDVETLASGSVTFTAAQICSDNVIVQSGSTAAIASAQTNTLPSASSLISRCLEFKGDSRTVRFENNAVQGSGRFTYGFNGGSGIDVFVASGSAVAAGKGDGAKLVPEAAAIVRFTNINGSSVSADFLEMINGD